MDLKAVFACSVFMMAGHVIVNADQNDYQDVESQTSPENSKMVVENMDSETTSLMQNDESDPDSIKHKGFCHWGPAVWYKPGFHIKCSCLRCTCQVGGNWNCNFFFPYCPYYYCGNQIFNPKTQICCCGKVHDKKSEYRCCGYYYYDARISKCCNYYSVKSKKSNCPRDKI